MKVGATFEFNGEQYRANPRSYQGSRCIDRRGTECAFTGSVCRSGAVGSSKSPFPCDDDGGLIAVRCGERHQLQRWRVGDERV